MKNNLLLAALALVAAINTIVLAGVAYNRSGTPDATLQLTERELRQTQNGFGEGENTGIALQLSYVRDDLTWFDAAKLRALGFDPKAYVKRNNNGHHHDGKNPLPRQAYVVLEYDGPAWIERLKQKENELAAFPERIAKGKTTIDAQKRAQQKLDRMRTTASRLIPVDVGASPEALRALYPDRSRYLVTAAEVRMRVNYGQANGGILDTARGTITRLLINPISLPERFHSVLSKATSTSSVKPHNRYYGYNAKPPRYRVTVQYGRRFEPWIVDLQKIEPPSS